MVLSCSSVTEGNAVYSNVILTETGLLNYITTYKLLKEKTPNALETLNEGGHDEQASNHELRNIIKASGMSYQVFVDLNTKVGTIFSLLEANMDTYQTIQNAHEEGIDELERSIQEMIDDPNVPQTEKENLRASLEETRRGKQQVNSLFEQNKEKARKMYQKIQKKLKKVATKEEWEIVYRHNEALQEAYQGYSRPQLKGGL